MRRLAIFTTFFDASPAYSLNQCVQDQIRMLVRGGYKPVVIVVNGFKPVEMYSHPDVTLAYIPHFPVNNDGTLPDDYQELVAQTRDALISILKDCDVCITHDVVYQPAHLIHNLASREVAERLPNLKWLHWIHSATSPEILCSNESVRPLLKRPFSNSLICYPNPYDIPRVAENYGYEEDQVKWVPHPVDIPAYFGFHPFTKKLVEQKGLLDTDFIVCYPARLDRGKQPEHIIGILGAMKKRFKCSVRLVLMDFHSTAGDKVTYREELKDIAGRFGLKDDVIFLSEFDESLRYDAPREMVRDLMLISSFYVHPSSSETYSLATQEAALCKNFLILNRDFPPMMSIWGRWPIYKQFSSAINAITGRNGATMWDWSDGSRRTVPEDVETYYNDLASNIYYYVTNNPVLMEQKMVRQERSIEYVFRNFLEPLLNR